MKALKDEDSSIVEIENQFKALYMILIKWQNNTTC